MTALERFIQPRTLARIRNLPLVARTVAEGFLHGLQKSHQRGVGVEFSQYRSYEPGDDPGRIDWKLFARSDRHFVREAERESEIAVWFVLDCSRSMRLQSEQGAWTKFDHARCLVASLAWLAQRQGDLSGLLSISDQSPLLVPPGAGEKQWHRLLKALHTLTPEGRFPAPESILGYLPRLQASGMVIVVSDFHQSHDEILATLKRLRTSRNEVLALQLLCADELNFPFQGPIRFEDLETGEQVVLAGRQARAAYLERLAAHQGELRRRLALAGISLYSIDIDQPLDEALYHFMTSRQRLRRS